MQDVIAHLRHLEAEVINSARAWHGIAGDGRKIGAAANGAPRDVRSPPIDAARRIGCAGAATANDVGGPGAGGAGPGRSHSAAGWSFSSIIPGRTAIDLAERHTADGAAFQTDFACGQLEQNPLTGSRQGPIYT